MSTQITISEAKSNVVYLQTTGSAVITGNSPISLIASGIGSLVIPANTLVEGTTYRYSMGGILDNDNVSGEVVKFAIGLDNFIPVSLTGPTTLQYSMPPLNNGYFKIEGEFTITNSGSVLTSVLFTCGDNAVPVVPNTTSAYSSAVIIDVTVPYTFALAASFGSALGTNKIGSWTFILEKIK